MAAFPVISTKWLTKDFPAVRALDRVEIDVRAGEVHGVVGENGAGKSTLVRILAGILQPTSGSVLFRGEAVTLTRPIDAMRRGIAMIHQELNLIDELSVADNIFLGRERMHGGVLRGLVDRRTTIDESRTLLANVGSTVDPRRRVRTLSIAEKQMVEIAKALSHDAAVLIMDEPTAVLTRLETESLFELIHRLRARGVGIVYISHILPEVLRVCDRVTVMRDGRVVTTLARTAIGEGSEAEAKLASLMVGRPMEDHFPARDAPGGDVAIRVSHLSIPGRVDDVSFDVREGEIFGFAGLIGAGRTELGEAIAGLRRPGSGRIALRSGALEVRRPRDAVKRGVAYLSEDRRGRGLTMGLTVVENITLVSLRRYARGFIRKGEERNAAQAHINRLSIRGRLRDRIETLSGGNQQKVAIAKWLETEPAVLILDEPTRGVDIGAKEEIYRLIKELAGRGMACIFISSEINELLGMCHRIAVMRAGRIVGILEGAGATEEQVMHLAAGVSGGGAAA